MTAEKDLHALLATMHPELREGEYVYALWPHGRPLAGAIAAATGEHIDGEPEEVKLLARLFECQEYLPAFSIVAELDGEIVGHVISTRGWVDGLELLGLGPIGVVPRLQRHGIGTALMNETVARANTAGERGIALLGSPEYYSRFGFVPSPSLGVAPPE